MRALRASDPRLDGLADLWWLDLPRRAARVSRTLATVLRDGTYLGASPRIAAVAPIVAMVLGLLMGWLLPFHDPNDEFRVYSGSFVVVAVMIAVSQLSASLGAWLLAGFVIGDLVLFDHARALDRCSCGPLEDIVRVRVPLVVSYALLALLVIVIPVAVRGLNAFRVLLTDRRRQRFWPIAAVAAAALAGFLVFGWTQGFPVLIRPIWTWVHSSPDRAAIAPVQVGGENLAIIAAVAAAVRIVLEWGALKAREPRMIRWNLVAVAPTPPAPTPAVDASTTARIRRLREGIRAFPSWWTIPVTAALLTLLLAGLITGWGDALLVLVGMSAALALRWWLGTVPSYTRSLDRIPLAVRLIGATLISYVVMRALLDPAVRTFGEDSFRALLVLLILGTAITALFAPRVAARDTAASMAR